MGAVVVVCTFMDAAWAREAEGVEAMRACGSVVYCNNDLLSVVQLSGLFNDSKTFVDMPLNGTVEEVLEAFSALGASPGLGEVAAFVQRWFLPAGSDLYPWKPTDWQEEPPIVASISNPELSAWASALNGIWLELGRELSPDVAAAPAAHSLIPVAHPFIVPGGRFREYYYWDAYWIIHGLLATDMADTAAGMVSNMLQLVDTYGFVPNGGRVYYLNRSQPPLLTQMCLVYYEYLVEKGDDGSAAEFLSAALPILDEEYEFWMTTHVAEVEVGGESFTLNRYNAHCSYPRPEGYVEDVETAEEAGVAEPLLPNQLYVDLSSGAETGWDYSSRWFADHEDISTIRTSELLPVDLNAILFRNELTLSRLYSALGETDAREGYPCDVTERRREGDSRRELHWERDNCRRVGRESAAAKSAEYLQYAEERKAAFEAVLWNDEVGLWYDFNTTAGAQVDPTYFYPSVFAPLWAELYWNNETAAAASLSPEYVTERFLSAVDQFGALDFPGGLPASLVMTGQQWDFPNGWAPIQAWAIFGLQVLDNEEAAQQARTLAMGWMQNNYNGWVALEAMFEKYNVTSTSGLPGGGGEYTTVTGFGWTNGLALQLLARYCSDDDCFSLTGSPNGDGTTNNSSKEALYWLASVVGLLLAGAAIVCGAAAVAYWVHARRQGKRQLPADLDSDGFSMALE
eukprot:CAMPEP_0114612570 /NCGR_PEP_ID=MMETSP0168-20121206/4689_1 /TAXON_ID=95228 ORGANISM="Vannella sp., Strain DIVA3 517/6/12" /NCGR_SAMPLE_ID=MMETSP0168 /ASSEMBLY_ACC=CAM_ASM_000044 /LENGTH=684 /DNA_ID=CAMNT_0001823557 /DNA_START=57 /DNA_END=2109 /DNA_ORIENTATION=+